MGGRAALDILPRVLPVGFFADERGVGAGGRRVKSFSGGFGKAEDCASASIDGEEPVLRAEDDVRGGIRFVDGEEIAGGIFGDAGCSEGTAAEVRNVVGLNRSDWRIGIVLDVTVGIDADIADVQAALRGAKLNGVVIFAGEVAEADRTVFDGGDERGRVLVGADLGGFNEKRVAGEFVRAQQIALRVGDCICAVGADSVRNRAGLALLRSLWIIVAVVESMEIVKKSPTEAVPL